MSDDQPLQAADSNDDVDLKVGLRIASVAMLRILAHARCPIPIHSEIEFLTACSVASGYAVAD